MKPESKSNSEIVLYQTADGKTRLEVQFQGETAWLSQAQMAELFQTTQQNGSLHIQNVFAERELPETSVVKESLTTAADGKFNRSSVNFYAASTRAQRISSSRRVSRASSGTAVTAMVSPTALKTSME